MGQCAPSKFTRKEHQILMRGMLPEILIVREEIVSVIQANIDADLSKCGLFDFEFIDLCGKNASVPNLKPVTAINCRVMKKLAGNGAVYVRMTKDYEDVVYECGFRCKRLAAPGID